MKRHYLNPAAMKQTIQQVEPARSRTLAGDVNHVSTRNVYSNAYVSNAYVHDPESLYNEVGQEQFLRSLIGMQLHTLSFSAFGQLVRQLLLRSGYSSVRACGEGSSRKTWGEGGLELLAFSHTDLSTSLTAIQLKQHREPVPRRFVDELRGVMLRLRADRGLIVSTAPFSMLAQETAGEAGLPPVQLIDGTRLSAMLVERGLGLRTVRQEHEIPVRQIFDAEFFAALEKGAKVEKEAKAKADGVTVKSDETATLKAAP